MSLPFMENIWWWNRHQNGNGLSTPANPNMHMDLIKFQSDVLLLILSPLQHCIRCVRLKCNIFFLWFPQSKHTHTHQMNNERIEYGLVRLPKKWQFSINITLMPFGRVVCSLSAFLGFHTDLWLPRWTVNRFRGSGFGAHECIENSTLYRIL